MLLDEFQVAHILFREVQSKQHARMCCKLSIRIKRFCRRGGAGKFPSAGSRWNSPGSWLIRLLLNFSEFMVLNSVALNMLVW
jgi:hypothetical protein